MNSKTTNNRWIWEGKPVPVWFTACLMVVHIGFALFMNLIVFKIGYLDPIHTATHGWINRTLSANVIGLLIEVVIILFIIGKLSSSDVGIPKEKLWLGLVGTFIFWLTINVFDLLTVFLTNSDISFNSTLLNHPNVVLGGFIGQVFGNALLEEILFRGFLFVQVCLLLGKINHYTLCMLAGLLLSQSVFALIHIPNRIASGYVGMEYLFDFFQLVFIGVLFAMIYLLTRNLFFVIGVHALLNNPPMLFESNFSNSIVLLAIFLLVVFLLVINRRDYVHRKSTVKLSSRGN